MIWGIYYCRSKFVGCTILKLVFAASIYHIWGERNDRIFKQKGVELKVSFGQIVENVRACLCG